MIFLQKETSVPVPRVYALFKAVNKQNHMVKYIVMERITSRTLVEEWPNLDQPAKAAITSTLRSSLEHMRNLKSLGGFCSIGHRGLLDGLFWTPDLELP